MNNIFDLFNDRKSGIEALYENANNENYVMEEAVEEATDGFETIEEATEYMDELLVECMDDAIEFQAACYLENLVLEQMMYEDFNEEEMQLTIEGAMKERMAKAGASLQEMWRKFKEWFNNVINNFVNHFTSGKKLVEKYGAQKIVNAMKDCETKVKMNEYGDLAKASNAVAFYVNKLSQLSLYATPDRNKILDVVQAESVNAAAEKVRKLYITSDKPVVKKIREINASQAINVCASGGDFVKYLKDWRGQIDKSFDAMIKQMNRKDNGDYMANVKFGATLRNKIINEAIKCVNKITKEYRAIIIKALGKNGKDDVIKAKGEVVDDKPDREVKGLLGDGRKEGQKALGQGDYLAASWSEFDEDNEYIEEGIKDTIVTAKDKAKGKLNDMKEKHGEKKNAKAIAKKERQIEKIRQQLQKAKDFAQNQKEFADEFEIEAEADIKTLVDQIEAIRAKLAEKKAVAEESFFSDDEEIEALEEALKEKVGQLKDKVKGKLNDMKEKHGEKKNAKAIAKAEKDIEKIRQQLQRAKDFAQNQNEFVEEFEKEAAEDIQALLNKIENIKAKLAKEKEEVQESANLYDDIDFE